MLHLRAKAIPFVRILRRTNMPITIAMSDLCLSAPPPPLPSLSELSHLRAQVFWGKGHFSSNLRRCGTLLSGFVIQGNEMSVSCTSILTCSVGEVVWFFICVGNWLQLWLVNSKAVLRTLHSQLWLATWPMWKPFLTTHLSIPDGCFFCFSRAKWFTIRHHGWLIFAPLGLTLSLVGRNVLFHQFLLISLESENLHFCENTAAE